MPLLPVSLRRRPRYRAGSIIGTTAARVFGGYLHQRELSPELSTRHRRYKTFGDILANTSIVAAGVRRYLNLLAGSRWTFTPSDEDGDAMYAELAEEMLTDDPETPWHRVVRRAALFRLYGFSCQEFVVGRREDGWLSFEDILPRAQRTIEKWELDRAGRVVTMVQRSPQSQELLAIPRAKMLYLVDDALDDSPEGLGLLRHLVEPAKRLRRYEQLEGIGFDASLDGIPIARAPLALLDEMIEAGSITREDADKLKKPLDDFIAGHVRGLKQGVLLDSVTYEREEAGGGTAPSAQLMWNLERLQGSSADAHAANAAAIERVNREMARILGVEQLLLGSEGSGSYALSKDKTSSFFLVVDSALTEIREQISLDLLAPLWLMNGWDFAMMPEVTTETIRFSSIEEVTAALRDMAMAGAPISPDDPVVQHVRSLMAAPMAPDDVIARAVDALAGTGMGAGGTGDGGTGDGGTDDGGGGE